MILYDNQMSGNCYKVRLLLSHLGVALYRTGEPVPPNSASENAETKGSGSLLLAHLGIPCERRELDVVDRSDRARTLGGLNPALRVPTLVLQDGRALAESGAILFHLAEGTEYLPRDAFERAQVLQWMFFEQYSLEPNVAVVRFRVHAGIAAAPQDTAERRAAGEAALGALDAHLAGRGWLVGDRYTIADIALYGYTHVAHEGGFALEDRPGIRAWIDRVAAQRGHITIDD